MRKLIYTTFFLFMAFKGNSQPSNAENPAEKRVKEIISLINKYDVTVANKYIMENYAPAFLQQLPMEEHRALIARINDEAKHLDLEFIETPKSDEAGALCRFELTDVWRQVLVRIEPSAPYRVIALHVKLASPPPGKASKKMPATDDAASTELDALVKKLEKENIFSGNVLVARNGKILFHKAYGLASKEYSIPNNLSTKFIIGSVNKMFTATGILQLIEQNKISLEDPVSKVLSGVLADSVARKIKIKHLLTHTSGLDDFLFTAEMSQKSKENFRTIADYMPGLADDTLLFEPGTQWHYSNTGFLILGIILEKISGLSYEEYINKYVYQPAGMASTFFPELDHVNQGLADTYEKDYLTGKPVFYNTRYYQVIKGTPAGGGFSTCTDLLNFMQALAAGKLLKPETVQQMQTAKPDMNSPDYGFGTQIFDANSYGHTGGGPGTSAWVKFDKQSGLTFIVLGNTNAGSNAVIRTAGELFTRS